ncbi:MEDS domain-containing protein [Saccharothrix lopnurensis]|uniref:MEDS domain-containing protein n=1 Tax=Saccharothrix lopnurensis TaxID=1670621 RepID=A0ABW1P8B6_9PSEU
MRRSGLVTHVRGLGAHDHVCWRYGDRDEFLARLREFLAEGLALGHRVRYVGPGDVGSLVADLRGVEGVDEALRTGAAEVTPLGATYPAGAVVEPAAQVRVYAEATEAALAAGYTGFRVAADCTPLVRTPEQLAAFARYEHQADHHMADHPFSAMCAYSGAEVDEHAFAQIACMHPSTNTPHPGFRLHAAGDRVTALGGEVDLGNGDLFALALERAEPPPRGGRLVLDAAELSFLDHRGLLRLVDHADERGATVELRTAWPGVATLVDLLGLDVRVEHLA